MLYVPQKSTGWYALTGWLSPHIADKRYRLSLLALRHPCWMSRLMWLGVYLERHSIHCKLLSLQILGNFESRSRSILPINPTFLGTLLMRTQSLMHNLQWICSFHWSSTAEDESWTFSARQERNFPWSDSSGMKITVVVLTLPSGLT